jgi:hypothetical protein
MAKVVIVKEFSNGTGDGEGKTYVKIGDKVYDPTTAISWKYVEYVDRDGIILRFDASASTKAKANKVTNYVFGLDELLKDLEVDFEVVEK